MGSASSAATRYSTTNPDPQISKAIEETRKKYQSSSSSSSFKDKDKENFPTCGIKLSYLRKWSEKILNSWTMKGYTTAQVVEKVIIPETKTYQCSFCELLNALEPDSGNVDQANVFVSHCWKYKFVDVIDTLVSYFHEEVKIYLWFDIFCLNQHVDQSASKESTWFTSLMKQGIKSTGRLVVALPSWSTPIPFSRSWCLWEIYCGIDSKAKVEIAYGEKSCDEFVNEIDHNPLQCLERMNGLIQSAKSECTLKPEQTLIHDLIKRKPGYESFNQKIFDWLKRWMASTYERHVKEYTQGGGEMDQSVSWLKLRNLSFLFVDLAQYDQAEKLMQQCLDDQKSLGLNNLDYVATQDALAFIYSKQGKYNDAEKLYLACLDKQKVLRGEDHADTLLTIYHLADLYNRKNSYADAEKYYLQCLKKQQDKLGQHHLQTLTTLYDLALLYNKTNNVEQTEVYYLLCLEGRRRAFGNDDAKTLALLDEIGTFLLNKQKFTESEKYLVECLEKRRTILGLEHPLTLSCMNKVATLYKEQDKSHSEKLRSRTTSMS